MAEALDIAASVIQFVDIGSRFLFKLSRFCSDIRDAPQSLQDLCIDLRQQLDIAQSVLINRSTIVKLTTTSDPIGASLRLHINLIKDLDSKLEHLTFEEDDELWRRGWKAIRTIKRKDEILQIFQRIERQKASLFLWLTETNL